MVTVRFAKADDLPAMMAADPKALPHSRRRHLILQAINHQQCLVAESDSAVVGYVMFSRCFYDNMFLELLVVAPDFRRRGVATALIHHVQRIAGTPKLFTSANRSNHAAHELFQHCGFEESGYIDNLDQNDPEIVYFKRIERPNS